jgi:hypothetical protein
VQVKRWQARQRPLDQHAKPESHFHCSRGGQPAAIQSRSSSGRQSLARPMRTGRGTRPAASQERQVRTDARQSAAASTAVSSNSNPLETERGKLGGLRLIRESSVLMHGTSRQNLAVCPPLGRIWAHSKNNVKVTWRLSCARCQRPLNRSPRCDNSTSCWRGRGVHAARTRIPGSNARPRAQPSSNALSVLILT